MSSNENAAGVSRDSDGVTAEAETPTTSAATRTRITHHAYLGSHPPHDEALGYLGSLLAVDPVTSKWVLKTCWPALFPQPATHALAYLRTLASSFDVAGFDLGVDLPDVAAPAGGTAELLQRAGAGWSWLADATFVFCLGGCTDASARHDICGIACEAGLPPDAVAEYTALIAALATDSDTTRVLANVCALSHYDSDAWKAIVDYRGLSFHEALRPLRNALASLDTIKEAVHLSLDMTGERWKVLDCMSGIPDEGLAVRIAVAANRQVRLSKFGAFKQKVESFVARDRAMLDEAQRIVRAFGQQHKEPAGPRSTAVADRNVGYGNQAWNDHLDQAYDALQACLDDHDKAVAEASDQIARIADGRW